VNGRGEKGTRALKVRVKTGKNRSLSSKLWLERQLNDPYVAKAKREGLRSRASYKLAEIDDKHKILKPGGRVLDLGAAPGGWSQVAAQRVGGKGRVVAIDVIAMESIPGVEFMQLDFLDPAAPATLRAMLDGPADVVLSDMAGGTFLAKVLQGGTETALLAALKRDFASVKHVKPAASRADSAELYVLAAGFRGVQRGE
jgi:23S rRNA (uridine2552-2'-O)-methyltransferase